MQLFRLFDAAEGTARGVARGVPAHTFGDELIFEQLHVGGNLTRQIGFGLAAANERDDPSDETT